MALVRWHRTAEPLRMLEGLQEEMNRLFNTSLVRFPEFGTTDGAAFWTPALDMHETKDDLVVQCELPGMKLEDINVSLQENTLTIEGERKKIAETKEENYYRVERWYGKFHRAMELPTLVDGEKVHATYDSGVLKIVMPKRPEVKPKQIQVKVS